MRGARRGAGLRPTARRAGVRDAHEESAHAESRMRANRPGGRRMRRDGIDRLQKTGSGVIFERGAGRRARKMNRKRGRERKRGAQRDGVRRVFPRPGLTTVGGGERRERGGRKERRKERPYPKPLRRAPVCVCVCASAGRVCDCACVSVYNRPGPGGWRPFRLAQCCRAAA